MLYHLMAGVMVVYNHNRVRQRTSRGVADLGPRARTAKRGRREESTNNWDAGLVRVWHARARNGFVAREKHQRPSRRVGKPEQGRETL